MPAFTSAEFEDEILLDIANSALDVVSAKRPTFSRANVQAEVFRQMQGVRFTKPAERILTATRATDLAVAQALLITTPNLHHTPRFLLRADGTSKFQGTGHWLYTSTTLLDAEARLLDAGQRLDAAVVSSATVAEVTEQTTPRKEPSSSRSTRPSASSRSRPRAGPSIFWWAPRARASQRPWRDCAPPGKWSTVPAR